MPETDQQQPETHTAEHDILKEYLAAQEAAEQVSEARQTEVPERPEPQASGSDTFARFVPVESAQDEEKTVVHVAQQDGAVIVEKQQEREIRTVSTAEL